MSSNNTSCLGCEKRFVGCHSTCEDYLTFRKEFDEKKRVIYEAKKKENDYKNFKIQSTRKAMKRRGDYI